ncbi:Scr1 family TA system antitoxin-like transcriptional regulator [Actinomadura luteofluorescens]|uniref:Transcriptional regulator with XRE-family HTH domain n=1 Tax=Actinomadura luteofluorescens TaxID=46163 RepID=A0A7Y9EK57_9ACTN|nr:helix-turn-helix transcriptional regulator [Actinomadura luteofluorescens]NYD49137.1 transcriptional regulator with XRE-family HTH domain [Actinomadura luteofluorescens]
MARKPRRDLQTVSPTLIAYGNQVRYYRERMGLSQDRLGDRFPVSGSYIGQIEVGKTRCTSDFAQQLDEIVSAQGCLIRLWKDLVQDAAYPTWFDWPPIERDAMMLQAFELSVVHGLLQTPKYAMALLDDEAAVSARMARQNILARENPSPPMLSVMLDENILTRDVGGSEVMREQLEQLILLQARRCIIQVVPAEVHDGLSGSFILATMADRSEVAYVETALRGMTMAGAGDVARLSEALVSLRASAYSVKESVELIRKVVEEKWT